MEQSSRIAFVNLLFRRLGKPHPLYAVNRLPDGDASVLHVVGHVGAEEKMILPEKREAALHGVVAVAIERGIGVKHLQILYGMARKTGETVRPEALEAVIPM